MNLPVGQNMNRVFLKCLPYLPCSRKLDCNVGRRTHPGWSLACLNILLETSMSGSYQVIKQRSRRAGTVCAWSSTARVRMNRGAPVMPWSYPGQLSSSWPLNHSNSSTGYLRWSVVLDHMNTEANCCSQSQGVGPSHCCLGETVQKKRTLNINILQILSQGHPAERIKAE